MRHFFKSSIVQKHHLKKEKKTYFVECVFRITCRSRFPKAALPGFFSFLVQQQHVATRTSAHLGTRQHWYTHLCEDALFAAAWSLANKMARATPSINTGFAVWTSLRTDQCSVNCRGRQRLTCFPLELVLKKISHRIKQKCIFLPICSSLFLASKRLT